MFLKDLVFDFITCRSSSDFINSFPSNVILLILVIFPSSKVKVKSGDTAEVLSKKIQKLEHRYLPEIVEHLVSGLL